MPARRGYTALRHDYAVALSQAGRVERPHPRFNGRVVVTARDIGPADPYLRVKAHRLVKFLVYRDSPTWRAEVLRRYTAGPRAVLP